MSAVSKIYRRIAGQTVTLAGYHRLYEGPDHLLVVRESGYREEYRRFFYRDLQAVVVRPTNRRRLLSAIWGGLVLLTALPAIAALLSKVEILPILLGVLALLCTAGLLVNLLLGPTCECYLQTAMQFEPLPALRRMNRAQQFLPRLRARVAEVQGSLEPGEVLGRMSAARAESVAGGGESPPVMEVSPPAA